MYMHTQKNAVYKFSSKTTSSADRQQFFLGEREKGNEHFHMKINLRAHHYVELFENKFCSAVQQLPFLTACLRCYFVSIFFSIDIFSMVSLPFRRIFGGNSSKLQIFFLRNFLSKLFIKNLHKSP